MICSLFRGAHCGTTVAIDYSRDVKYRFVLALKKVFPKFRKVFFCKEL